MSFNNTFLWDEKGNIYGGKPERFVSMKKCVYIILMKEEHQLQYKHNEVFVLAKLRLIKILTLHSDSTLKYNSIFPPFFFGQANKDIHYKFREGFTWRGCNKAHTLYTISVKNRQAKKNKVYKKQLPFSYFKLNQPTITL